MTGFTFDIAEAVAQMERCIVLDAVQGRVTMFSVMCINEDGVSSHGGQVVCIIDGLLSETAARRAIDETVANAVDLNLEENDTGCKYVPVAVGLPMELMTALVHQLAGHEASADKEWRMRADGEGLE